MNGREKTAIQAASPPCMARHRRTHFRLRRSSVEAHWPPLTPEHGFPSLLGRPGPRALPLGPLPENRGAGNVLSLHAPFVKRVKKRRGPRWAARRVRSDDDFLRWHYPHQVEGRSRRFLSAITAPLYFSALLWHQRQGLSRPRFSKNVEKDRGSPLQCGKKRRMIETSEQRGVRIAGLRGDCHGLDLT